MAFAAAVNGATRYEMWLETGRRGRFLSPARACFLGTETALMLKEHEHATSTRII
jgi:hypothetical protein